jgi:dienelactone hydrolase
VATVVLFHSVHGLGPATLRAAGRMREEGHTVHTPDLFAGRTAATTEEGMELADGIGRDELLRRAVTATAPLTTGGLVWSGLSFGGSVAQTLALGDSGARGLLLFHGTSDLADDAVADDLPVQLHVAEPDPFETEDWLNAWYLRMVRAGADVEVHRYPGAGHLFTDEDSEDHDAEAAARTWRTALAFLAER